MPLPETMDPPAEATVRRLKEVLHDATAIVYVDGDFRGTAFFVSDRLLLTCAHVIDGGTIIEIEPMGRMRRGAQVAGRDEAADLVLLETTPCDEQVIPCVVMDTRLHDGTYWLAGFPRADIVPDPGLEMRRYQGGPREAPTGGYQMLRFGAGEIITYGMSGGPVLDVQTGAVVAVTRWSSDPRDALGGAGIPIAVAAEKLQQIDRLLKKSLPAMTTWRNQLGRDHWAALGRSWDIGACVDLRVSGTLSSWLVTLEPGDGHQGDGLAHDLTGRDLGEDVAEALFRWAQRRRVRDADEVSLLGTLLQSALFPRDVADHLRKVSSADSVMVRLHVKHGDELADIPWELAAVPGARDRFLAADEPFRFVRVSDSDLEDGDSLPRALPAPEPTGVKVLAAVAQPRHWQRQYPVVLPRHRGTPYKWPQPEEIRERLRESVERSGLAIRVPDSPRWSVVESELKTGAYSVLHFMGVGQCEGDDSPRIAFIDDDGNGEAWEDPRTVIETAAAHGVRLVVLELLLPPTDYDYEPLTPSALGDVITGSVEAVVVTQLPVHPKQCNVFNLSFYEALGRREPIESAVQAGRRTVRVDKPVEDAAGFGWFAVVTAPQSGIQLVSRALSKPLTAGVTSPRHSTAL